MVILAFDSFKSCLSSKLAEEAAEQALTEAKIQSMSLPMSDGGEGMLDAFICAYSRLDKENRVAWIKCKVHDPMMNPVLAQYAIVNNSTAIIEVAQCIGLAHVDLRHFDIVSASSYGVGELIVDALNRGCSKFIVGLGGTAVSDCGKGMLKALGSRINEIADVLLASDVKAPLLGPKGAAHVFAPQKGASTTQVELLEHQAKEFSDKSKTLLHHDCSKVPGAGAAGGLGFAFMQYMNAKITSGADFLLRLYNFDHLLKNADAVITGEGSSDAQTLMGKLPFVILQHALRKHVPVYLLAGRVSDIDELTHAGFYSIHSINEHYKGSNSMDSKVAFNNIKQSVHLLISGFSRKQ